MKKLDVIIIGALIIISVIALGIYNLIYSDKNLNSTNNYVVIYLDGELYKEVPLTEEKTIDIDTELGFNEIHIHDNGVEMHHADCPDQVCVKTGFIEKVGQRIVCLPNKVYIEIVGKEVPEVDDVSS